MEVFTEGGFLDSVWMVWNLRCLGVAILALPFFALALHYYAQWKVEWMKRDNELERILSEKEVRLAKIEALGMQAAQAQSSGPRVIPFTSHSNRVKMIDDEGEDKEEDNLLQREMIKPEREVVTLHDGRQIPEEDLLYFIGRARSEDGPGLAIGRWKSEEKWHQEKVEDILDFLHEVGLVTERRNGRACEWVGEFNRGEILEAVFDSQFDSIESSPRPIG